MEQEKAKPNNIPRRKFPTFLVSPGIQLRNGFFLFLREPSFCFSYSEITDSAIGTIMRDVAVLLTHMLSTAAESMKPPMIDAGFALIRCKISKAIRLCKLHDCSAKAIKNPPRKRKINGDPDAHETMLDIE